MSGFCLFLPQWSVWSWISRRGWRALSTSQTRGVWVDFICLTQISKVSNPNFWSLISCVFWSARMRSAAVREITRWETYCSFGLFLTSCFDINKNNAWLEHLFNPLSLWFQRVDCVFLDDGGFVVMSNQDDHISKVNCGILLEHFKYLCAKYKMRKWGTLKSNNLFMFE